jgi:hypothetical protein
MRNPKLTKAILKNLILINHIMGRLLLRLERTMAEPKRTMARWGDMP